MQRTAFASIALISASPALAHDGLHIHPHADSPVWLTLVAVAVGIGAIATVIWSSK